MNTTEMSNINKENNVSSRIIKISREEFYLFFKEIEDFFFKYGIIDFPSEDLCNIKKDIIRLDQIILEELVIYYYNAYYKRNQLLIPENNEKFFTILMKFCYNFCIKKGKNTSKKIYRFLEKHKLAIKSDNISELIEEVTKKVSRDIIN
ncbi:MAG: hypothetical protein N4A38_00795 [Candidatus Gracilibacteria bacterium]|nr:hypothetical protein [Candidatus Gracilibacteria bacterium]